MRDNDIIAAARMSGRSALSEPDGKALLAEFGIRVPRGLLVTGAQDIGADIDLTPPFAVKVVSSEILHKSDAGGVMLNVVGLEAAHATISEMGERPGIRDARIDGFLIEEMAPAGTELVIGAVQDPHFGPMIMIGLGGVFVEILGDVAFRLCPISETDALTMLKGLRGFGLLTGARGRASVPLEAITDLLLRIGGKDGLLMKHGHELSEVDINPVIVTAKGAVAVDARFILGETRGHAHGDRQSKPFDDLPVRQRFAPLFMPETVAVVGASTQSTTIANSFIRRMKDFGYGGEIYPVHPKAPSIEGLPAYPSLAETPRPVDYAYVAIGAAAIPDALARANGNVRFAQIISSGFGEVVEGRELEKDLVRKAASAGCRLLGPNSLGLYSPRGGVTFAVDAPKQPGPVGVVVQSGGLGTDIIKRGQWRGLRFSGLVTAGNCADLEPSDLLEFYLDDPDTKVVGFYVEDIKDGRRFFELLRSPAATKPVVILRGGRSSYGHAAAASHTGALAGDGRAWEALCAQTGCVPVRTVDEFIDTLLAFQYLSPRRHSPTKRVVLFGNGGGTSVLATDSFAEQGLEIAPFEGEPRGRLEALNLPPGTSVANPIDAPVRTLQEKDGAVAAEILDIVYATANPDAVVVHLNLASFVGRGDKDPVDNLIDAIVTTGGAVQERPHLLMALRVDGSPELEARRRVYQERALAAGIPVYGELTNIAQALASVSRFERHR